MWFSWRDVASGLPDEFAWDTSIACTTGLKLYYYYTFSAVGSRISSKLIFASGFVYCDRAYYGFCVASLECKNVSSEVEDLVRTHLKKRKL